jgi:hypothetical protein
MEKQRRQIQNRFQDLFEGIVIATLMSGPNGTTFLGAQKAGFLKEYRGQTSIFRE